MHAQGVCAHVCVHGLFHEMYVYTGCVCARGTCLRCALCVHALCVCVCTVCICAWSVCTQGLYMHKHGVCTGAFFHRHECDSHLLTGGLIPALCPRARPQGLSSFTPTSAWEGLVQRGVAHASAASVSLCCFPWIWGWGPP